MTNVIEKVYTDKKDIIQALTRHMDFFNTENTWGSVIVGISAAFEEQRAKNAEIDPSIISNVKTSLMGPMAGIGDSVTQGIVKTILLGIGIDFALQGNPIGPVLFVLLFSIYAAGLSYFMFFSGYRMGKNAVVSILSSDIARYFTDSLKIMSMMVIGGLAASNIKASTQLVFNFGGTTVEVQPLLDKILPGMLPFLFLLLSVYLLKKKGKSPTVVLLVLFVIGFLASFLGILS